MEQSFRIQRLRLFICSGELEQLLCLNSSQVPCALLTRSVESSPTLRPHGGGSNRSHAETLWFLPRVTQATSKHVLPGVSTHVHVSVNTSQLKPPWKKPATDDVRRPPQRAQSPA